jgi:hypothetical protein
MPCMVEPCLELLRCFTRFRRRRIRNIKSPPNLYDLTRHWSHPAAAGVRDFELLPTLSGRLLHKLDEDGRCNWASELMSIMFMGLRKLWDIRRLVLFLGALNLGLSLVAAHAAVLSLHGKCPQRVVVACTLVAVGAAIRIIWMVGMGFAQAVTASAMIAQASEPTSFDATSTTSQRRRWYKRWLWCSRIGFLVTVVQSIGALYLTFIVVSKLAKYLDCSCSGGGK